MSFTTLSLGQESEVDCHAIPSLVDDVGDYVDYALSIPRGSGMLDLLFDWLKKTQFNIRASCRVTES